MRFFIVLVIVSLYLPQIVNASGASSTEYVELPNPIAGLDGASGEEAIAIIIGRIILQAMTVAGSIALVAFIVGAFVWMTSAGKSDKVQMGAKIMLSAAIGLFIIFSAYGILNQIINTVT